MSTPPAPPIEPAPPDDLELLLAVLPPHLVERLHEEPEVDSLLEIVLDLGRTPEARFAERTVELAAVPASAADLDHVVDRVGRFGQDNRAGIERTLHRISALRNRDGRVVGLTCRVGRAVRGTVDIVRDVVERGDSMLLLGRPGVGKTTLLREAARVLADDLGKRVVVVDTSNEIAGDGDIPHPGIGRARRMQVPSPDAQHAVMIEAVENHMPEVVVIDEIGTSAEALAARTIAERGVQLVATAHGNSLENLLQNPTLADLVGGVQAVTLSDEEARRRRTRKTVLERKAPPTFEVLVEIQAQGRLAVHHRTAEAVDAHLAGHAPRPEVRVRRDDGEVEIRPPEPAPERPERAASYPGAGVRGDSGYVERRRVHRIFPYAVSRSRLERGIKKLGLKARIVSDLDDADLILTTKAQERRQPKRLREAQMGGTPIHVVKSNTSVQLENFLRTLLPPPRTGRPGGGPARRAGAEGRGRDGRVGGDGRGEDSDGALSEVESGIEQAREQGQPVELAPRGRYLRRLQHELVQRRGLTSRSRGHEPYRRVVVYPI